jgi:hypothetical protein
MVRRRIIAAALGLMALIHATSDPALWSSGTYATARDLAPRSVWALGFALAAVLLAIRRVPRWVAAAFMCGHLTAWSICLLIPVITEEAQSGTAWIWPGLVAVLTIEAAASDPRR